ncbi:MAG: LacI family transcriptional regulator, partial [Pseudopedobacter saltans]
MKKNSIKDVAQLAKVSIATVSYVLNNRHMDRITDETKSRVKKAVKELGYRPNKLAQGLKTNKSKTLGFIVADITNPFFSELAQLV